MKTGCGRSGRGGGLSSCCPWEVPGGWQERGCCQGQGSGPTLASPVSGLCPARREAQGPGSAPPSAGCSPLPLVTEAERTHPWPVAGGPPPWSAAFSRRAVSGQGGSHLHGRGLVAPGGDHPGSGSLVFALQEQGFPTIRGLIFIFIGNRQMPGRQGCCGEQASPPSSVVPGLALVLPPKAA